MEPRPDTSVRFGEFELDLHTRELYRDGARLKIRGHPIDVLAVLLEHPGELVTREKVHKRLWPGNTFVDFEQILNNSIGKLRDALGDNAESPRFIETLPRLGYRFIAPVEKPASTPDQAAQLQPQEQQPVPLPLAQTRPHPISKRKLLWRALALVVVLASFAYWYLRRPLPAPHISHYEQLTLDGKRKIPIGTDGSRLYVLVMRPWPALAEVPISGGKVTEIPIDLESRSDLVIPGLSPDGSSLLVMNRFAPQNGFMVWVVGVAGHPVRYLTRAWRAAWSPDGNKVVFVDAHGDIYSMATSGGEPHLLHREDAPASQITRTRDISWSPDGATIRLSKSGGRIFEMSSTGANFHEWLPGWNGGIQKCFGRWTPDGRFYLFLAGRALAKGPTFRPLAQIWVSDERRRGIRRGASEPMLLASGPMLWGDPIPGRDGKTIFARGVSLRGELNRYDQRSKQMQPYLGGISAEMLDFSRDGKYVAYVSFPDGILWRANRDGSGLVQLTEPPLYPRNPRWSPDGSQIVFTDNTASGVDIIYVVSSQGGNPRRLLPGDSGPQNLADWSPDGSRVVYTTFAGFSFVPSVDPSKTEAHIVELATSKITLLPKSPRGFWGALWSPDGRYIAGHSFDQTELVMFDLKTRQWITLPPKGDFAFHNWSHDGRYLYFLSQVRDKVGVYRVLVPQGKEELILDLPESDQTLHSTGYYGAWFSLDPTDAPLILRNAGTDEIYALTLEGM